MEQDGFGDAGVDGFPADGIGNACAATAETGARRQRDGQGKPGRDGGIAGGPAGGQDVAADQCRARIVGYDGTEETGYDSGRAGRGRAGGCARRNANAAAAEGHTIAATTEGQQ